MAKFNKIKDGDVLFKSELGWFYVLLILIFILGWGTLDFISEIIFSNQSGFGFYVFGIIIVIPFIFFVFVLLFVGDLRYQGFYLGDKIIFKNKRVKLVFSSIEFMDETVYIKDLDYFLNDQGSKVKLIFIDKEKTMNSIIGGGDDYLTLSKSYTKNKTEVIDFLNNKIKELKIKSSAVEN
jgi:hypothetical protein